MPSRRPDVTTQEKNRRGGAKLTTVSGAVTSRQAALEILSLNVSGPADRDGQLITRRMVESRLAELAAHPPGCGCGLCDLLPLVTCSKVWWTGSRWQASINLTRLRAKDVAALRDRGRLNPTFNGPAGAKPPSNLSGSAKGAIETHHDCTV